MRRLSLKSRIRMQVVYISSLIGGCFVFEVGKNFPTVFN